MSEQKKVLGVYGAGGSHWVEDGFPVRTIFPSQRVPELDPFLMLDYAGPAHFKPSSQARGVEEHPHRGFETVTISYQGRSIIGIPGDTRAASIRVTCNG